MHMKKQLLKLFLALSLLSLLTGITASCSDKASLLPLGKNATVLAFGDSLTYGTGTSRDKAYPAILSTLIGRKVINSGIPGEVSQKGLQRLPAQLKKYQPELLILCHGANDILRKKDMAAAKKNIQQMIDLARSNNIQVVLIGVPEFGIFLNTSPIYAELAETNKLPLEKDIIGDILANNALKSDHIHPNAPGYQLLAEKVRDLLVTAGALQTDAKDQIR
jgi:acyl-CoA thioesterase-1